MKNLAASLKHRIKILENIALDDMYDLWQVKLELFAGIKQIQPSSLKFFGNVKSGNVIEASYVAFYVRFTDQIDENMRISFKEKQFLIKKLVNVDEKSQVLEIIALKVV